MGRKNKQTEQKPTGCMAFFVSVGRSVNQRVAAARNALRRKFRRDNKMRPLEPEEVENETGTPDLIFTLKPLGPAKTAQLRASSPEVETAPVTDVTGDACAVDTPSDETHDVEADYHVITVEEVAGAFADNIIQRAVAQVQAEEEHVQSVSLTSTIVSAIADEAVTLSLSKLAVSDTIELDTSHIIRDTVICEKSATSIASSEISQIAELAVSESLSKIAASGNTNASARRPRSVNEMLEYFGIPSTPRDTTGLPPVDI